MGKSIVQALRSVLRFLNIMVRFVFGQDAVQLRDRIHDYLNNHRDKIIKGGLLYLGLSIGISILFLIIGSIFGWCGLNGAAHAIIAVGFLISSLAWIVLHLGMTGFLKLVNLITKPTELFEETVDFHYDSENVARFFKRGFNAITWITVATLYCSIIPVWRSLAGFILLLPILLFLIVSVPGWGFKPNIKLYKRIWKIVFVLFVITTLRFLPDSFWVKTTGYNPPRWFNFHYSKTQKTIRKGENLIAKAEDQMANMTLVLKVDSLEKELKNGVPTDSLGLADLKKVIKDTRTAIDSAKNTRNQESLPVMAWGTGKKWYGGVKKWFDDDSTDSKKPEPVAQPVVSQTLQRDTLNVTANHWVTVQRPLHYKDQFVFLSTKKDIEFKFNWQKNEAARRLQAEQRADGLWWAFVEISAEPVDPSIRLQIRHKQKAEVFYWVWGSP